MKFRVAIEGIPGVTVRVAASDVVQTIPVAVYSRDDHPAIFLDITVEDQSIRYAFRVDPENDNGDSTDLGHILYAGGSIQLQNSQQIRHFRYINHTQQTTAVLQMTPGFEVGTN